MLITCIGVSWCAVLMLAWFMLFFFESWFVFCYSFKQRLEFFVGFLCIFVFLFDSFYHSGHLEFLFPTFT